MSWMKLWYHCWKSVEIDSWTPLEPVWTLSQAPKTVLRWGSQLCCRFAPAVFWMLTINTPKTTGVPWGLWMASVPRTESKRPLEKTLIFSAWRFDDFGKFLIDSTSCQAFEEVQTAIKAQVLMDAHPAHGSFFQRETWLTVFYHVKHLKPELTTSREVTKA